MLNELLVDELELMLRTEGARMHIQMHLSGREKPQKCLPNSSGHIRVMTRRGECVLAIGDKLLWTAHYAAPKSLSPMTIDHFRKLKVLFERIYSSKVTQVETESLQVKKVQIRAMKHGRESRRKLQKMYTRVRWAKTLS